MKAGSILSAYKRKIMNRKLAAILGPNYCGSTYAGYVLGSHDDVGFVSESVRFNRENHVRGDDCINCEKRGKSCHIWTPDLIGTDPAVWFKTIADRFSERLGTNLLVSTDKYAKAYDGKTEGCDVFPVVFFREPISFVSTYKIYHMLATAEKRADQLTYMDKKCSSVGGILEYLEAHYDAILKYVDRFDDVQFVDHDYLTAYKDTFRMICDFLGIEFDPACLEFWKYEHHTIGGNDGAHSQSNANEHVGRLMFPDIMESKNWGLWNTQEREIHVDFRWKSVMTANEILQIVDSRFYREIYVPMQVKFMDQLKNWISENEIQKF